MNIINKPQPKTKIAVKIEKLEKLLGRSLDMDERGNDYGFIFWLYMGESAEEVFKKMGSVYNIKL